MEPQAGRLGGRLVKRLGGLRTGLLDERPPERLRERLSDPLREQYGGLRFASLTRFWPLKCKKSGVRSG